MAVDRHFRHVLVLEAQAVDEIVRRQMLRMVLVFHLGDQLLDGLRYGPAIGFYLCYIAGLVYLVSLPALKDGGSAWVPAAVLGAMAYGTYEFTSYAVMRDWHWSMVATDLAWGTVLTAVAGAGGLAVARALG